MPGANTACERNKSHVFPPKKHGLPVVNGKLAHPPGHNVYNDRHMCARIYKQKACLSMLVPMCSFCDRIGLVYSISTTHFSRIHIYTRGLTELLQTKYYFACLGFGDGMQ